MDLHVSAHFVSSVDSCFSFLYRPTNDLITVIFVIKITASDLNSTEHLLDADEPQLDLRSIVEFKQRQILPAYPIGAHSVDIITAIVGNYTCTASNMHGSKSASMTLLARGNFMNILIHPFN